MAKKTTRKTTRKAAGKAARKPSKPTRRAAAPTRKAAVKNPARPGRAPRRIAGKRASTKRAAPKTAAPVAPAPGTPAPPDPMARRAGAFVRFAHKILADMAAGIPDDHACAQLPGAINHKLWTLGHLAHTNQWFACLIDGQPMTLPAEWEALFGMGSTPSADPAAYPPIADIRAALDASVDRLCAAIESMTAEDLSSPTAFDGAGFVHDRLDSALKAAWHKGWHLGQLAALRKALGIPPMLGG